MSVYITLTANQNRLKPGENICDGEMMNYMNYIYIYIYTSTHVITSTKFRRKQTWRLTKAIAEMKCDNEQTMKLE